MALLASTSTQGWMRRMGRRWQLLHRAIYAIGMLAVLHYWWQKAGKHDFLQPTIYGCILFVLLCWRVIYAIRAREKAG
jgi:sulfoxide reductase heme-binding subunit YedZ